MAPFRQDRKLTSVIGSNLPTDVYRKAIHDFFSQTGFVHTTHLVRDKDSNSKGIAYVVYTTREEAEKAVELLDNTQFHDNTISVRLTKQHRNNENNQKRHKTFRDVSKEETYDTKRNDNKTNKLKVFKDEFEEEETNEFKQNDTDNRRHKTFSNEYFEGERDDVVKNGNKIHKTFTDEDFEDEDNMENSINKGHKTFTDEDVEEKKDDIANEPKISTDKKSKSEKKKAKKKKKHKTLTDEDVKEEQDDLEDNDVKVLTLSTSKETKIEKAKSKNDKRGKKKGRIVIRNLNFKATEDDVRGHFSRFGDISEIVILKNNNGHPSGRAFVQFKNATQASAAIEECNMKPLLGRTIAVDVAVPKDQYSAQKTQPLLPDIKIKEEEISSDEERDSSPVKKEVINDSEVKEEGGGDVDIKEEDDVEIKEELEMKGEMKSEEENDSGVEENASDDTDEEDEEEVQEEDTNVQSKNKNLSPKKSRQLSNDVQEQKTLFIKNLSFETTKEEIAQVLGKYGELKYVLICMDKLTEHPRGSAFAQFKELAAADAVLAVVTDPAKEQDFTVRGRKMHILRAISKNDVKTRKEERENNTGKDKRNLYLAREGFIRERTQAAAGVSKTDLALRFKLECMKKRLLKNLHMFVSPNRLCVHNLPEELTDKELKQIFIKHSPKGAKITEARIMKNLKDLNASGVPTSKGFGFVNLTEHEHALAALRKINNNPDIFTDFKRPIVEFSVENRSLLNAREKRLQKSREMNPTAKKNVPADASNLKGKKKVDKKNKLKEKSKKNAENKNSGEAEVLPAFAGTVNDPTLAADKALLTRLGPKIRDRDKDQNRGKITRRKYKREQKDKAMGKKRKRHQGDDFVPLIPDSKARENEQEPERKKKKKGNKNPKKMNKEKREDMREDASFNLLVQKYKSKMNSGRPNVPTKRWYE